MATRAKRSITPKLQWMIICEQVTFDQGNPSFIRIFDGVHFAAFPAIAPLTISVQFREGLGLHRHWLKITRPNGDVVDGTETEFFLFNARSAHRIDGRVIIDFLEAGTYWFAAILDGKEVLKLPLSVGAGPTTTTTPTMADG